MYLGFAPTPDTAPLSVCRKVEIKPHDSSRLCFLVTKPLLVIRHQVFLRNTGTQGQPRAGWGWNHITTQLHVRTDKALGAGQGILNYESKNTKSVDTLMHIVPILSCSEMPPFVQRYTKLRIIGRSCPSLRMLLFKDFCAKTLQSCTSEQSPFAAPSLA